jgi:formate dehydrogenase subunit gamma
MSQKTTIIPFRGQKPDRAASTAEAICAKHGNHPDALIEILHDLQQEVGHVPESSLPVIARSLNLSRAEVHGVVTFYHDFHTSPQKKHVIKICAAEACQAMGARALLALAEKLARGKKVEIEKTYCLGLCASSPAMMVNGAVKARVDSRALRATLAGLT